MKSDLEMNEFNELKFTININEFVDEFKFIMDKKIKYLINEIFNNLHEEFEKNCNIENCDIEEYFMIIQEYNREIRNKAMQRITKNRIIFSNNSIKETLMKNFKKNVGWSILKQNANYTREDIKNIIFKNNSTRKNVKLVI